MTNDYFSALESYIASLKTIDEGKRNAMLYRIGIYLRKKFGLYGAILLQYLLDINSMKCNPSLDEGEVAKIAESIDKSKARLGASLCSVDEYLAKEISFFTSATASKPSGMLTIGQFINDCKNGKYQKLIEAIRAEPDKERRNALKKRLPAVTIQSEVCEHRKREFCKNNGIIGLDIDGLEDVEAAKQATAALPYVIAVIVSASGRGLFVIVALNRPVKNLKTLLAKLQEDFPFPIDKTCSDVSRLRYVSYDPDLILNDNVIPYNTKKKGESIVSLRSHPIIKNK